MGGWHIRPNDFDEVYKLNNRGRRFMINGPRFLSTWLECRLPFCDNDLVDLAMSIPREIRGAFQLYQKMLLRNFLPFYEDIPWQYTSFPIHLPRFPSQGWFWGKKWVLKWVLFSIWSRIRSAFQSPEFVAYDSWVRQEPAKSFVEGLLNSKAALYPEFVPRQEVIVCWQRHLNGFDETRQLFAYLTLELWLQQVFEGKYRPNGDSPAEVWTMSPLTLWTEDFSRNTKQHGESVFRGSKPRSNRINGVKRGRVALKPSGKPGMNRTGYLS